MGAGCYYTLEENRDIKAYWLDLGLQEESDEFLYDDEMVDLKYIIEEMIKVDSFGADDWSYYGDMYKIILEPTYYGDGIVINLEYQVVDHKLKGLQSYNYENVYRKIIKHINKFLPLRVATTGYTSVEMGINEALK